MFSFLFDKSLYITKNTFEGRYIDHFLHKLLPLSIKIVGIIIFAHTIKSCTINHNINISKIGQEYLPLKIKKIKMSNNNQSQQKYYGSDDDNDLEDIQPSTSKVPQVIVKHLPSSETQSSRISDTNHLILQKLNEQNHKLDNLIGRVAALEQSNKAILDVVTELKRSFPKFITVPPATQMSIDRHLL
jgi:hypothetical protein